MATSAMLLVAVVAASAAAHVLLKLGMNDVGELGIEQFRRPVALTATLFSTPAILVAIPVYSASFIGWVAVLSRLNLSVAQPSLALTYAIIPLASWALLSEPIPKLQWLGIGVIVLGVLLVLGGGRG